jgi:DNA-binding NarL/FixJ family response regulator
MQMINVLVADNQALTREGIKAVLSHVADFKIVCEAGNAEDLDKMIGKFRPHVVIIDHNYHRDIKSLFIAYPASRFLLLSNSLNSNEVPDFIEHGITNHLFKECSHNDLIRAVYATAKGEQLLNEDAIQSDLTDQLNINDGIKSSLSSREAEIVKLIAGGCTNKQIAEKLYLSIHTIKTHRKNIIKKLGFTFKNASELILLISYLNDLLI